MLHINNITYYIGTKTIFEKASGRVAAGQKVGLVGANGSGKTTLLRLIAGKLELDGGEINVAKQARMETISQDAPSGPKSPVETVLAADRERNDLLLELEESPSPTRLAEIHHRLIDIDAHSAPARAASILAGLGFSEAAQHLPVDNLSGGWKMRVNLACVLFSEPDLLLLDEPTNHLDLESVIWLQSYLRQYRKTLVVVSHDRDLLNRVTDNTLLVKDGQLMQFSGNFAACEAALAQRMANAQAEIKKQELRRKELESFVNRFRAKATKAKQAQSRLKMLERMAPVQRLSLNERINFKFKKPVYDPSPLVRLDEVSVGYLPDQPVLQHLTLSVYKDDRIALLGANGNGKSTFVKLIAGFLNEMNGLVVRAQKLMVGYFAQDHLEQLDGTLTPLAQMSLKMGEASEKTVRAYLGQFGIGESRAEVLIRNLSGGEKTRLALSLTALEAPNLLLLDEPTNHLDMDSCAALIEGLNAYEGAVILISHDRRLVEAASDQLWVIDNGGCSEFLGDMDDYQSFLLNKRNQRPGDAAPSDDGRSSRKDVRRLAAEKRKAIAPLKKAVDNAEAQMTTLSTAKEKVEQELSDPALYNENPERLKTLSGEMKALAQQLETAEEEWLTAHEALEAAMES